MKIYLRWAVSALAAIPSHTVLGYIADGTYPTVELNLRWIAFDALNGLYFSDIFIGTPPQRITVAYAPTSGDLFVHNIKDTIYEKSCAQQTPNPVCFPEYDNITSSSYINVGPGAFNFPFLGTDCSGSYVTETITLGGISIKTQVMASIDSGDLPVNVLGIGFDTMQGGPNHGTFPRYSSIMDQLQSQGAIASQTQSMWLNPDLGIDNSPNSFPNGSVLFGKLDKSLFEGDLVTIPVTNPLDTNPAKDPLNWNVAVASITKNDAPENNVIANARGDSCILDATTGFFALHNASFSRLVESFPKAILNTSISLPFYQIDCSERFNTANSLSFTFVDSSNPAIHQTIEVPPEEVIWPTRNVVPGGDPNTCAIAAFSWEDYFGTAGVGSIYNCVLGVNVLKKCICCS